MLLKKELTPSSLLFPVITAFDKTEAEEIG